MSEKNHLLPDGFHSSFRQYDLHRLLIAGTTSIRSINVSRYGLLDFSRCLHLTLTSSSLATDDRDNSRSGYLRSHSGWEGDFV